RWIVHASTGPDRIAFGTGPPRKTRVALLFLGLRARTKDALLQWRSTMKQTRSHDVRIRRPSAPRSSPFFRLRSSVRESWVRSGSLGFAGITLLLITGGAAYANCKFTDPIFHGFSSSFEQCGPAAAAFFWNHGRAVQRIISISANADAASPAGHD